MLSIYKFKQIIVLLVLVSFLVVVSLGFSTMTHRSDGNIQGDCPFSLSTSLCFQNTLPAIFHHISAYQSFINIPIQSNIMIPSFYILLIMSIIFIFLMDYFLLKLFEYIRYIRGSPPNILSSKKIIRWLSLLENSPSR